MGGPRPKWIKLAANFEAISEMDIACDSSHSHLPWGKTVDNEGRSLCYKLGRAIISTEILHVAGSMHTAAITESKHAGSARITL